ncbi:uncharacterized protein Eint_020140 [Encephalitozoon intestinalis ATCC 50506]|uniref:Uncharacterized protein n=1 Tax=Encephalitozoon intestinalis (strain ATCC 50506) TaxID=876142 RepID=E0S5N0_ENCIT|nr:uncharacterized protein Eint_020140 [Encephalitozoon intestinalis ATCC 50506]ADM11015.1 hypothetical protein Eint_020140 [Encephalitozoon intestinalis ATCC 50506]UTX44662.1 hypothetical protein GPK93_02g01770 [Encephalitozoon intestinalis]
MKNKPGLLPKWLFIYTMSKTIYIFIKYKNHLSISRHLDSGSMHTYFALVLGATRLIASRKITMVEFYSSIAASFLAEGLFFVCLGFCGIYPIHRVLVETFLSLFTLAWMVFLYPYYLLEDSEPPSKSKEKSVKHQ